MSMTHTERQAIYAVTPKGRATRARYDASPHSHQKNIDWCAKRRNENPERHKAEFDAWYHGRPPLQRLLTTARKSAKKRRLEFNLQEADLLPLPVYCPILGLRLVYETRLGWDPRDAARYSLASLDRKDNSRGYVKGNVFIVSWRANQLKSDGTADEHEAIASWMKRVANPVGGQIES
jgi:hypothetical protein